MIKSKQRPPRVPSNEGPSSGSEPSSTTTASASKPSAKPEEEDDKAGKYTKSEARRRKNKKKDKKKELQIVSIRELKKDTNFLRHLTLRGRDDEDSRIPSASQKGGKNEENKNSGDVDGDGKRKRQESAPVVTKKAKKRKENVGLVNEVSQSTELFANLLSRC